jgi:activating signal cointegrator 1
MMKALTLWEPWASLIFCAKKIETRSRPIKYRGPIAIHAAKTLSKSAKIWTAATPEIGAALPVPVDELPVGAVIGTVEIVDCLKVIEKNALTAVLSNGRTVSGDELEFGDYTPGRYAWITKNPRMFAEPIPARGQQGLWNWQPPEGAEWNEYEKITGKEA